MLCTSPVILSWALWHHREIVAPMKQTISFLIANKRIQFKKSIFAYTYLRMRLRTIWRKLVGERIISPQVLPHKEPKNGEECAKSIYSHISHWLESPLNWLNNNFTLSLTTSLLALCSINAHNSTEYFPVSCLNILASRLAIDCKTNHINPIFLVVSEAL